MGFCYAKKISGAFESCWQGGAPLHIRMMRVLSCTFASMTGPASYAMDNSKDTIQHMA